MDPNVTRPFSTSEVLYHCTCGATLRLVPTVGGTCNHCQRTVSPKLLEHRLGMTVAFDDGSFHFDHDTVGSATISLDSGHSTDENPDVLVGEMLGHFKIIAPLGHGGMGQIYRALDTSLQRYVAVKVLRSGINQTTTTTRTSDDEVDKLLQEAISQARVNHPNIVTIYYVGKQHGHPFLAMELIHGQPMSERIASGEMGFDEIAKIALDIVSALEFSHELDLIHGDIKPSNVLITKDGVAKLSDFGMARSASQDAGGAVGGTPSYLSPELLNGDPPSIQSDIYALGVSFYEMTFGKLPLKLTGTTVPQWLEDHQANKLEFPTPWPSSVPEFWKNVLEKMLAKDPSQRYSSYDQLLVDIRRLQPGSKVIARFFPRLIAAGFDWVSVLSLAIVFQVVLAFAAWQSVVEQNPIIPIALKLCNFLPIVGYTMLAYFWRQSIGRSLMHIRVVNQFGLRPTSNEMVIRSLIRMQFPWTVIFLGIFNNGHPVWLIWSLLVLFICSIIFLVADILLMVFNRAGRSVHDLISGTRVVLDTGASA